MPTLLETIKNNQAKASPSPVSAPAAQTGVQIGNILQTAQTGKAGEVSTLPAQSNVAEKEAQMASQNAVRNTVQEGQKAEAGLVSAEDNQNKTIALQDNMQKEQREDGRSRLLQQTNDILQEYQNGSRVLDANRDKARLEQVGFGLRLSNDSYLADLSRQGQKSRLNNDVSFKEEMTRTAFADEEELMRNDMTFRAMMRADGREFEKMMASMNIEYALKIAAAESEQANNNTKWAGVGTLVSGAAAGYNAYEDGQDKKTKNAIPNKPSGQGVG